MEISGCHTISTTRFTNNRSIINRRLNKTPYEAMNGHKPSISFLHVFGYCCFIKNNRDQLTKFQPKSNESIFLGYSTKSKAYRFLNCHTYVIEECFDITFDDNFFGTQNSLMLRYTSWTLMLHLLGLRILKLSMKSILKAVLD